MIGQEPTGKELITMIIDRMITDSVCITVINLILSFVITIYAFFYNSHRGVLWWGILLLIMGIYITYDIFSGILVRKKNKNEINTLLMRELYEVIGIINQKSATGIFELENFVEDRINDLHPINKDIFKNKVDMETVASYVCENIHRALSNVHGKEINCEVTVFRRNMHSNKIKMIAYSNNRDEKPDSFIETYKLNSKNKRMCHVNIFMKNSSSIVCLPNKTAIKNNFYFNEKSKKREEKICQYVGYPIKTNRGIVELLLQIDVAKEDILGKNEDEMKKLAEELIFPFVTILHIALERDIMFNKYYDLIESLLSDAYPHFDSEAI